ncbi:hypothetical protein [Pseudogracilibacillus auburnensis]|uniref:hypothetical protein n=1 Tax=Pseudogracilibacillus auburnensis TaxID=1494959 RepID=UPI001A979D8B|nr:hypothetical protein [Pseudogracilibacillus auburnensis]MBO1001728.1 hypothetical protein [Pseudogracilibacillus auburnensis]
MEVKVKRRTGFMGAASKVVLLVDEKEETKLKNNEEYNVTSNKNSITLKAKQMFFGSNALEAKNGDNVELKINPICLLLYVVSFVLLFIAVFNDGREIKLLFSAGALILLIITSIFSVKSWFVLK